MFGGPSHEPLSAVEYLDWQAIFIRRHEEQEEAEKKAEREASRKRRR
tara:strand:+ start:359 stop:499 length:141 start_codon:yes stop_codon:yes gene_type:complete